MNPQHIPEGSIVITPGEVYSEVKELTTVVRDLVTADKAEQRERAKLETRLAKVENDISTIKQRLWFVAGAASAVGGSLGSAIVAAVSQR